MRSFKTFIKDVATKPPQVMPLVGLAHIAWLLWSLFHVGAHTLEWLQVLWLVAYTAFWIAACDMRRWGANGYMALTLINTILFLTIKNVYDRDMYMSSIFIVDGIFSFFLLFHYKKFT